MTQKDFKVKKGLIVGGDITSNTNGLVFNYNANSLSIGGSAVALQANVDTVQDNVTAIALGSTAGTDLVQDNLIVFATNAIANTNTVSSNVDSLETSVNTIFANVNTVSSNVDSLETSVNTIRANVNTVQDNVIAAISTAAANDFTTYTTLSSTINTVSSNVDTLETSVNTIRANVNTVQDNVVSAISTAAANDYVTYTQLNANINTVSANVDSLETSVNTIRANVNAVQDNVATVTSQLNSFGTYANTTFTTNAHIDTKIAALVDAAPTTLDTLNELAAAIGDDPNFAATLSGLVGAAEANVVAVDTRLSANINTVSSNVDSLETSVNTIFANVNSVSSNVNTVSSNVGTLTTSVNTIKANVDSVASNVSSLTTSVNTIRANVNSVQDNVASIISGSTAFTGPVTFNDNISADRAILNTQLQIGSNVSTGVGTGTVAIFTFPGATYRAAELLMMVQDITNTEYQLSKILVVHDGTSVYTTEYGVLHTGSSDLTTFTATIDGSDIVTISSVGGSANKKITVASHYLIQ